MNGTSSCHPKSKSNSDASSSVSVTPIKGPTSPQSSLLASGQSYILIPSFTLSSGQELHNVPLAYKTWGKLNPKTRDNALVVSHALTGSADVEDWWGPLLGNGRLFDPTRFFIICANVLGSPYGSAGPCTRKGGEQLQANGEAQTQESWNRNQWWGPEFPQTTVRDDVRIQKVLLDYLGVEQIAAVVGGSMGGMAVLEWPLLFPVKNPSSSSSSSSKETHTSTSQAEQKPYIKAIVPIATCARHSAWGISWAEAQRQSIYSDPSFNHGYYDPKQPPRSGLAAARMAALLTYRSRDSFESRFGRRTGKGKKGTAATTATNSSSSPSAATTFSASDANSNLNGSGIHGNVNGRRASEAHNEGNRSPIPRVLSNQTISKNEIKTSNGTHFSGTATEQNRGEGEATTELSNLMRPTGTTPAVSPTALEQVDSPSKVSDPLAAGLETINLSESATPAPPSPATQSTQPQEEPQAKIFSAQSYLRYQGDKFVQRFDANCYIHLTRKMDAHDVAKGRTHWGIDSNGDTSREILEREEELDLDEDESALARVLNFLGTKQESNETSSASQSSSPSPTSSALPSPPKVLIISIESDGLFAPPEQILIHNLIPGSTLKHVVSPDGHDGFLLEFEQINEMVQGFLRETLKNDGIYEGDGVGFDEWKDWGKGSSDRNASGSQNGIRTGGTALPVKESVFGEVEDITRW